ncbi:hypothetical protein ACYKO2_01820 [Streptococcus suis]
MGLYLFVEQLNQIRDDMSEKLSSSKIDWKPICHDANNVNDTSERSGSSRKM